MDDPTGVVRRLSLPAPIEALADERLFIDPPQSAMGVLGVA